MDDQGFKEDLQRLTVFSSDSCQYIRNEALHVLEEVSLQKAAYDVKDRPKSDPEKSLRRLKLLAHQQMKVLSYDTVLRAVWGVISDDEVTLPDIDGFIATL